MALLARKGGPDSAVCKREKVPGSPGELHGTARRPNRETTPANRQEDEAGALLCDPKNPCW